MSFQRPATDLILPFHLENADVIGRVIRLGPALEAMLAGHDYPPAVAETVAEAAAMACVLSSSLKYDGLFTLQIQGDGPIRLVVVDVQSNGQMRAIARFDAALLAEAEAKDGEPVPKRLGAGVIAFTVDQGQHTDRYQGVAPLEGATLADCLHAYFRQSEQIDTALTIATRLDDGAPRATALMLQRLPNGDGDQDQADEDWRRAVILMSSVTPDELLSPDLPITDLLYRLFHEEGVRIFEHRDLLFRCRCSRKKVAGTLKSFPRAEIEDLLEDGKLEVTCEFCRTNYAFDEDDVAALFDGLDDGA